LADAGRFCIHASKHSSFPCSPKYGHTSQISGLHNGDALAALARLGAGCAVGDNTWSFLTNPDNPHHMLYTTEEEHGYGGFQILPRFATEIYFNCSTASQNLAMYNALYRSFFGKDSTIDELMQREAALVVRDGLLSLRHDPYMMVSGRRSA
jgi:hypothetical protein